MCYVFLWVFGASASQLMLVSGSLHPFLGHCKQKHKLKGYLCRWPSSNVYKTAQLYASIYYVSLKITLILYETGHIFKTS